MVAMFWAAWGINEWGAVAGIVGLFVALGAGGWMYLVWKTLSDIAVSAAHLPSTTAAVSQHTTDITGHGKTLANHDQILTSHGKQIGELESWRKGVDGKLTLIVMPPEAIKDTIQGK